MVEQSNVTTETVTVTSSSSPETALCPICYEKFHVDKATTTGASDKGGRNGVELTDDLPASSSVTRTSPRTTKTGNPKRRRFQVEGCGHEFCHECLAQHCKFAIMNRTVPVPCPQVAGSHEDDDDEEKKDDLLLQDTATTVGSSTTTSSNRRHCLSSDTVRAILMVSPVPVLVADHQDLDSDKENLQNDNENCNTAVNDDGDLEEQSLFPEIQLSRTFSTQRMSSSSSTSSTSVSELSVSSLPEYWTKYVRIQRLKEDPSLLSCPNCDELVAPPIPTDKSDDDPGEQGVEIIHHHHHQHLVDDNIDNDMPFQDLENPGSNSEGDIAPNHMNTIEDNDDEVLCFPQVACSSCQHCFCAIHGDIHSGMSCSEFSNTERFRDMQQSEQAIQAMSKRCSRANCGAPIAKIAGCDHIICAHCHQDFCYKCGTHIFLTGKVIRSCSNCRQGFVDHRYYGQYRIRLLLILPLHLLLSVIYISFVGVLAVLTCGFGCCFGCGTIEPQSSLSSSGSRKLNPGRGMCLAARVICMPIEALIRDCGCLRDNGDDIRS